MFRFGLKSLPKIPLDQELIWIHAVSLGETNVASLFVEKIKQENKNSYTTIFSWSLMKERIGYRKNSYSFNKQKNTFRNCYNKLFYNK